MKIEKLLELSRSKGVSKNYAKGFSERLRKKEAEFCEQEKNQAPNADFMNREYTI
jgi:hypothetical protein